LVTLRLTTLALFGALIAGAPLTAQQPAPSTSAAAQAGLPSDAEILAIIKQRVDDKRSAGMVVGVIDADGRQRIVSYGDPGPGQPPLDGNTVFEIGSISKVFTSTVLAQLVQEGKVRLEDSAQKYLPSTVHLPTRNGKAITLGNLAMQNSGLPRMPSNFKPADAANPYADYTVQQMYDFLSSYQLPRDPGAEFEYSNLGVGLLGHILSHVTGSSYEEMERHRVWAPLGMTNTAITLTPWMKSHLAIGHDPQGKVAANWDLPTLAGAGAIRSTTTDMLKFLDANLHPERGALQRAMAFAHEERVPAGNMRIGLNWLTAHAGPDKIVWHNGGTGGYRTFIGFDPSKKTGVVVMTNSAGEGADDVGFHILDSRLPLVPKPAPRKERTAIDVRPEILQSYVGRYQLTPAFILEVTFKDNALNLQATGQPAVRLWPESETSFFLKEVDAQVDFVRDPQGNVTGLVLHQNGQNAPAAKMPNGG
jgi:D-alanyl-D-alanine-carboxypeptidase/D-alanyl-D-alanine-endopeptidase